MRKSAWLQQLSGPENGGRGETRTPDPLLAKQVLCQLSYTPTVEKVGYILAVLEGIAFLLHLESLLASSPKMFMPVIWDLLLLLVVPLFVPSPRVHRSDSVRRQTP